MPERQRLRLLATFSDATADLLFAKDREGRMLFANPACLRALGRQWDDIAGRTVAQWHGVPAESAAIAANDREVMERGEHVVAEETLQTPDGRRIFLSTKSPLRDASGAIEGLVGISVDITERKCVEARLAQTRRELSLSMERTRAAMRAADIVIFTQDRDLRYTWISHDIRGLDPAPYLGRTDEEILGGLRQPVIDLKRAVLLDGQSRQGEFALDHIGEERFYELTVEPEFDETGTVCGLLGVAVDVTDRRRREMHVRYLMRELTHRTKNLLAVIQAMGRQTAAGCGSLTDFQERFAGRLQGLAGSHDLIVREDWRGASLRELIHSQLSHVVDSSDGRVTLKGDDIVLKPEAAQNIGLALHELAANAAKHGALSNDHGLVAIEWEQIEADGVRFVQLAWTERNGPPVRPPAVRGFGYKVIVDIIEKALDGTVDLSFPPEGLRWSLRYPAPLVHRTS